MMTLTREDLLGIWNHLLLQDLPGMKSVMTHARGYNVASNIAGFITENSIGRQVMTRDLVAKGRKVSGKLFGEDMVHLLRLSQAIA